MEPFLETAPAPAPARWISPTPPPTSPDQPPTAHAKPEQSSGDQPAGPGAAGEALAVLTSFGRRLLVLVPVYLAGGNGTQRGFCALRPRPLSGLAPGPRGERTEPSSRAAAAGR